MRPLKVSILCLVFATGFSVHAQPNLKDRFARLDTDRNGGISWAEAYRVRAREFVRLDNNFDGVLNKSEFHDRALAFSQFDADSDGRMELSEYTGHHHVMFEKADTDGNGSVDLQEFARIQQAIRDQPAKENNSRR